MSVEDGSLSTNIETQGMIPNDHLRRIAKQSKGRSSSSKSGKSNKSSYEVWASDQSNSAPGQASAGTKGSFLWIWDSDSIEDQLIILEKKPILSAAHPMNLMGLVTFLKYSHQLWKDAQQQGVLDSFNRYVTANMFAPGGGYVGVIDTETKEAVALFRVTKVNLPVPRSVHMSFWSTDGSAIIVANFNGKMIERIDVKRSKDGTITGLEFNVSASVYLGKAFVKTEDASFFQGSNAFGRPLIGSIAGDYAEADTRDITPSMICKESACEGTQPQGGARTKKCSNLPYHFF